MNALRAATLLLAALSAYAQTASPAGIDLAGMDRTVAPDENFFLYANGGWLDKTVIPADRGSTGVSRVLQDKTDARLLSLVLGLGKPGATVDADARKVRDWFTSYMDTVAIEKRGIAPLEPALARIAAVADKHQLAALLGSTLRADVDALNHTDHHTSNIFGLWVAQDLGDPSRYVPFLMQGGLNLPDREYYLDDSARMREIRDQYRAHVARMLELAGFDEPAARAARVLDLETRIARVHATRIETQDVRKANNLWRLEDFDTKAPGLSWRTFFGASGLAAQKEFIVWQPGATAGIARVVADAPLEAWKDQLAFRLIEHMAPLLPRAFVDEHFAFNGRVLAGTPQQLDRWRRGIALTNAALGDALGRLYVQKHFSVADKARAEAMVRDLLAAFGKRIDALAWMKPETKAHAKAKLAALKVYVGYPDRWRDYSGLEIVPGDAYGNQERAELFEYGRNLRKLGTPVDRSEWAMNTQAVNALNLPVMNAMNFPAAILQPPYFDAARTPAMNYAAIGMVIGHEISHSFDDTGALFDAKGRLADWWTPEDYAHFAAAGAALVKQYDAYRPLPDLAVKGRQVLSENIADLAGLATAYDAWKRSLGGQPAPEVQGLTGDQQFFLSYAQMWRAKFREPVLRERVLTGVHSLPEYRVATVRNLDPWYAAFPTQPGRALYLAPEERVRIW